MSGSRGVVILDSNVFDHLKDKNFRSSIGRGMAQRNLEVIPTDANVFEAMQGLNVKGRTFALATISDMTERGRRRPKIPSFLLHDKGAELVGLPKGNSKRTSFDLIVKNRKHLTPQVVHKARVLIDKRITRWDETNDAMKPKMVAELKRRGSRDPWGSTPSYLAGQWKEAAFGPSLMRAMWQYFGPPDTPAAQAQLFGDEAWQLYFDALGASVYERTISPTTPKRAGFLDLEQLTYLSLGRPRIFVTSDKALHRIASAVLANRYADSQVLWTQEFLAMAA